MINEYVINARQASDHRLEYTWTPNPFLGAANSFWVEYPFDIARIKGHDVFYPVLPLFLALGFADTRFHLVTRVSDQSVVNDQNPAFQQVLANWLDIVETEAVENFGKRIHVEADINGQMVGRGTLGPVPTQPPLFGTETALFLGGGGESLLALAKLTEQKLKPHLISYLGPGWIGSDPAKNESKLAQDQMVARELGLDLHHVHSNLYGLFAQMQNALSERTIVDAFFVNCVAFTPILVSLVAPMTGVCGFGTVYHGHEKHFEPDLSFHCFTKSFTDKLAWCFSPKFAYRHILWDLLKVDVFEQLCTKHSGFLKYQYSCYNNEHERWCLNCEKCLRYYILFKLYDAPFDVLGFDETRMLRNFARIRTEIASHIWSDTCSQAAYGGILAKTRARGKKDVYDFLSNLIREAKRIERKKKAQALIRPFVPKPVRRLVKRLLPAAPQGTAHA
jgi:hypothetical protein